MRIVKRTPCYCSVCDEPNALNVVAKHEKPAYDHIEMRFAVCLKHAEQLASMLLQHVRKAQRSPSPLPHHETAT